MCVAGLDEFPRAHAQGERALAAVVKDGVFAASGALAEERGQHVEAIRRGIGGQRDAGERGEGGGHVHMRDECGAFGAGCDFAGPPRDEWNAVPALKQCALCAAQRAVHRVLPRAVVGIAVVPHAAVVAGENDECVFGEAVLFEGGEDLPDGVVEFLNRVAARAGLAAADEAGIGHAGDVDAVGGEVEEEGAGFVLLDECDGLFCVGVGHVFIAPARGIAAGHPTDAAHAVHDGHVVPVGVLEFKQLGVLAAGGVVADLGLVTHADGVGGIQADDAVIFHIHARHTVAGRGHEEGVVEANLERAGRDLAVPIRPACAAETEVPFTDDAGFVSGGFQKRGKCGRARRDAERRIARCDGRTRLLPPRVAAREECAPSGRAGGRGRVGIGEAATVLRELVENGRLHEFRAVATEVAVADVVSEDENDVRFFRRDSRDADGENEGDERSEEAHNGGSLAANL